MAVVLQSLGNEFAEGQSVRSDCQPCLCWVFRKGGLSVNLTLPVTINLPGAFPKGPVAAFELIVAMHQPILIIDDDRSVRRALRLLLEIHGFDCKEADDGLEALALLDAGLSVDVIISDYHMPAINGVNFLQALPNRLSGKDVPVIMLSGNMTKEMERSAKEAGAYVVMAKPYDSPQLLAVVSRACTQPTSEDLP